MDRFLKVHSRNLKGKVVPEKTKRVIRVERWNKPELIVKMWTDEKKFVTPDDVEYPIKDYPVEFDEVLRGVTDIPKAIIALNPEFFSWDIEANCSKEYKAAKKEAPKETPKEKKEKKKDSSDFDAVLDDLKKEE